MFQVLDLILFGALQRRPRYELPFEDEKETVTFIMKAYHEIFPPLAIGSSSEEVRRE
jgi:hypothetical protein